MDEVRQVRGSSQKYKILESTVGSVRPDFILLTEDRTLDPLLQTLAVTSLTIMGAPGQFYATAPYTCHPPTLMVHNLSN